MAVRVIDKMRRDLEENATFEVTDLEMTLTDVKGGLESRVILEQVSIWLHICEPFSV
jgi:hypothetical protein